MRYREGDLSHTGVPAVPDDVVTGAALYTLALGVGLIIAGVRIRLKWVTFLGGGLTLTSAGYLVALLLGFH